MSAPARQAPATEQPTQPLPIPERGRVSPCRYVYDSGLIVFPIIPLAAIGTGALLRAYILATPDDAFYLTVTLLAIIPVWVVVALFMAWRTNREDTGADSAQRVG